VNFVISAENPVAALVLNFATLV